MFAYASVLSFVALASLVAGQSAEWGQCGGIGWSVTSCDLRLAVYLMNASGLAQHLVYLAQSARSSMIVIYFKYFRPHQFTDNYDRLLSMHSWICFKLINFN